MKLIRFIALLVSVFLLAACSEKRGVPVGEVSSDKSQQVRIREGTMLLRGVYGQAIDGTKIPNPYSDFVFLITPGTHTLWMRNVQTGTLYTPENLRCYRLEAEFKPGIPYIIDEDREKHIAQLKREDTGEILATGKQVDEKEAWTEECNWKK